MLKNVLIVVDDIEKSIEFYRDLFGLQVILKNFEDFDIDGLLAKYESGKYFVRYATELTELAGGQKLVRLYDPSGNLIEVRTPFRCN